MRGRRILARGWAGLITLGLGLAAALGGSAPRSPTGVAERPTSGYESPYRVEFHEPSGVLVGDLERTERGDPRRSGEVPFVEWYGRRVRERFGAWGPRARAYPPPAGLESWSARRKRERVIAVALRFVGYGYQHHHVPDWDPPSEWPWKESCVGRNGPGVDCSNFTGFVYNLALGVRVSTDVGLQAGTRLARGPGEARTPVRRVDLPESYEERLATLRTGDLLFIRNREGRVAHVVLWVGAIGRSPDGVPLVLDSTGEGHRDSNGRVIPCGVHLRPFGADSWYHRSASHALRIIED
jgi:hypothetical protein